jgi:hypothetical protein
VFLELIRITLILIFLIFVPSVLIFTEYKYNSEVIYSCIIIILGLLLILKFVDNIGVYLYFDYFIIIGPIIIALVIQKSLQTNLTIPISNANV